MDHNIKAVAPAATGVATYSANLFGMTVPDWVGVATIVYLVVMVVIKIRDHIKGRKDD